MTAAPAERVRPPARWVPAWVAPVSLALVAGGLAVSIYLTITHYTTSVRLACSASGVIDCQKVTTSPQSFIAGVPVAVLGVAFFVVAAVLCLPAAWRSGEPAVRYARIGWAVAGVVMVVRLVYAELFQIDAICLWCTVVHAISVLLFAVVLVGEAMAVQADSGSPAR
ncbi:MAG TPA: vitamin K epoxide reductase family protein [Gaiellales bacterium]